jgi:CHU_C Type IX secretion signal domain
MKKLILILLLATPILGTASHIVGGEFELIHISGSNYRLNLVLYFDKHNGNPGAKDQNITARIFRMWDNAPMMDVFLPLISEIEVAYSQPGCSIGDLDTDKLTYTTTISLSPNSFNHPAGYYVAWERCCRNYDITNIYSQPPGPAAIFAGQTFYLEIPPVVKNGEPFIDSTPRLFPPLSDYACKGKPYYVDFSGTDDDGDSLVYSLVTPLNTKGAIAVPPGGPGSRPYPDVLWAPGFSLDEVMRGAPDLAISTEGLLTVTPTMTGLFVFAAKCEEFRDGVKIGETRRDFQMLVVECRTAVPPVIKGRKLNDPSFTFRETMNVTFPHSIPNDARCIEVEVSDLDILNDFDGFTEQVRIRARVYGKASMQEVTFKTLTSATLNAAKTTATFTICFDECPPEKNTPYRIDIIAYDDACALPLLDTLRMTVTVQTPPNTPAHFVEPASDVVYSANEGDAKKIWPLKVVDDEGDLLTYGVKPKGFALASVGMNAILNRPTQGLLEGFFDWDPACDKYDFSVKRTFAVTLYADDDDFCSFNKPDSLHFNLTLIPPPNADPIIDTDLTTNASERFVDGGEVRIFEKIEFNVFGHDDDAGYPISFQAAGIGFKMIDYGMVFPLTAGEVDIASHFTWPLECSYFDLKERDVFVIEFILVDNSNKCKIYQADTVDVAFRILPPLNKQPELTMQNMHPETTVGVNAATTFLGKPIEFLFIGTDDDQTPVVDNIKIEMIGATGNLKPEGYSFSPVSGQRHIETKFFWNPDCSIFKDNLFLNNYEFKFRIFDDHCESAEADTVELKLNIEDYTSTDEAFEPPNVFTPNDDNFNDYFAMDGYEPRTKDDGIYDPNKEIGLPLDNCLNRFEYINIYNRWGKLVFTSDNRYFRWYAPDAAAGVYFYLLKFTNKDYKGSLTVRF